MTPHPPPGWLLDETAHAGRENLDVDHVARYDRKEDAGAPADVVYSRYALHHLPDFWKAVALARIRAMLRPGAVFRLSDVVFGFDPAEIDERIEAWCATIPAAADPGAWTRADLEEHVRDEHSTFTWLLEPLLLRAGFAIAEAAYSPDRIFARYLLTAV